MLYTEYDSPEDPEDFWKELEPYRIPQDEVNLATQDFSRDTLLKDEKFCNVYTGEVPSRWHRRAAIKWHDYIGTDGLHEFDTVCGLHSKCFHDNIIPFIGFCNDGDRLVLVTDYASNGSLDQYLQDSYNRRGLTWAKRLEICLGVAKGLKYVQSCLGEDMIVVLRSLKSRYILLDEDMNPKIYCLKYARLIKREQQQAYSKCVVSHQYLDPVYAESFLLNPEVDVYSLGVVLFELMSGMLAGVETSIEDARPQYLIPLIRQYYDAGLEKLIDPDISSQIDGSSFDLFKELAYKCISFNIKERPTIDMIIKTLEEALHTHSDRDAESIISHQGQNPKKFLLSYWELNSIEYQHGQLPDRFPNCKTFVRNYQESREVFLHELDMMCSFHHKNIIRFIAYYKGPVDITPLTHGIYSKDSVLMCIAFEFATNGSLYSHLYSREKMRCITWEQRLKICLGAARGLKCLHAGLGHRGRVTHRLFSSKKILLDDNMEAKIYDFAKSAIVPRYQQQVYQPMSYKKLPLKSISRETELYKDPMYAASCMVRTEIDVYPFGIVMFELLAGRLLYQYSREERDNGATFKLTTDIQQYYQTDQIKLVDPVIRDEVDNNSLDTYIQVAYKCLSLDLKDRPSMNTIVKMIEKLLNLQNNGTASTSTVPSPQSRILEEFRIPFDSIRGYINEDNEIGHGNYGTVYKGELSEDGQERTAAFKRINGKSGEFLKELELISKLRHENVIRFIGFCHEEKEMIIVTEYAANGNLHSHLHDLEIEVRLSWEQRLKICLGAAKGLRYLHTGLGKDDKVLHRDVKSANILLDDNMEAKICDFGLSRSAPAPPDSGVYPGVWGTDYYMDPIYRQSGKYRAASDVYSFGVVLFETLSGRTPYNDGKHLMNMVSRCKSGLPDHLIDPCIKHEKDERSFIWLQDLAYECTTLNYEERPTMDMIVDRIEDAWEYQVNKRIYSNGG